MTKSATSKSGAAPGPESTPTPGVPAQTLQFPSQGGAYIRLEDGSLIPDPAESGPGNGEKEA